MRLKPLTYLQLALGIQIKYLYCWKLVHLSILWLILCFELWISWYLSWTTSDDNMNVFTSQDHFLSDHESGIKRFHWKYYWQDQIICDPYSCMIFYFINILYNPILSGSDTEFDIIITLLKTCMLWSCAVVVFGASNKLISNLICATHSQR